MQIYTKILIGMVVGAVIGLVLGPKSEFLAHDSYVVNPAQESLLLDIHDPNSRITLPSEELRLLTVDTVTKEVATSAGGSKTVPTYVKVQFVFTEKMGLSDKNGTLAAALGGGDPVVVGSEVQAWLVMRHELLDSGDTIVFPVPVSGLGATIARWIAPVGDLFMRLIKMVIVPLVFCSLLVGVASLGDVRKLGRLGGRTLGLYLATTAAAVSIGLLAAHVISPGDYVADSDRASLVASYSSAADAKVDRATESKSAIDNILNIVPTNPMESLAGGNMLQIIFFAFLFGIALTMLEKGRATQIVNLMDTVQHAMILVIHMVMKLAPYGVAALIAVTIGQSGVSVLKALLVYSLTVVLGLSVLGGVVYGGLVRFVAKLRFVDFLKAARPAQLIAFSTSSSSATLPITLECAEQNLGISKSVSSFVIPLGSTVNMDGTALYQGVAAMFIAQVFGIDLSLGDQIGIVLTATAASIGAAGVPGAGMITLAAVLAQAGIPAVGLALILGMDRLLDMFRTTINVTGDLAVTSVMAVKEGETLRVLTKAEDSVDKTRGFVGRTDHEPQPVEPTGDAERVD